MTATIYPDIIAELDLGLPVKSVGTPVQTINITPYIYWEHAPLSIRYGRSSELDRFESGQVTFVLRDPDRRFDPSNTSSPYYPYIRPMVRLKISARWPKTSGTARRLFTGYVDTITPQPGKGLVRLVQMRASDAFAVLANEKFTSSFSTGASTNNAVGDILDVVGWPAGLRSLSTCDTRTDARAYTNSSALAAIQDLALCEGGSCYVNKSGQLTFKSRYYRALNRTIRGTFGNETNITNQWTMGQSLLGRTTIPRAAGWVSGTLAEQQIADLKSEMDYKLTKNDIKVTRSGGVEQTASDATSQLNYGVRTYTETSLVDTDLNAAARTSYLITRYRDPEFRIKQITIRGASNPSVLWPQIVNTGVGGTNTIDIDSRIRATDRLGRGQLGAFQQDLRVEGIEHTILPDDWVTTYRTSPDQAVWVLEDDELGILEVTTILAW